MVTAHFSENIPENIKCQQEDVGALLQRRIEAIAEEFNIEYFLREGVVRWIIDQDSAAYPCRSRWDKILRKNQEYKNSREFSFRYIARTIKNCTCIKKKDNIYVVNGKISLEFKINEENLSTIAHPCGTEFPLYSFILKYGDWWESRLVPLGLVVRKPDFINFSHQLINHEFIERLFSQKD
mgnify:FL=1